MKTVLIAGGTGLIGNQLVQQLTNMGVRVRVLSRTPRLEGQFAWDPAEGTMDDAALEGVDTVINLAGAGIADKRWTPVRKRILISSRVTSADTLRAAFIRTGHQPKTYVSASAIGIYGNSKEYWQTETAMIEQGGARPFMVDCCELWEAAADRIAALGIRTVKLRIGVVMAKEGGALAEFIKPLRFGIGTYFGDGKAWYSWIHRTDVCRMIIWAAENNSIEGVYNAVAPNPLRNINLVKATAKAMGKSAVFVPAPGSALRLILGEMSAVVFNSNRVSAEKVTKAGFVFEFPDIEEALQDIFKK